MGECKCSCAAIKILCTAGFRDKAINQSFGDMTVDILNDVLLAKRNE